MSRKIFIPVIAFVALLLGYYFISSNTLHTKIYVNIVESMTINEKKYSIVNDADVITEFITLYNKGKISKKDGDTTPSHIIVIQLKNGDKINIAGTTQGFHYVDDGKKLYKISNPSLSQYFRNRNMMSKNS